MTDDQQDDLSYRLVLKEQKQTPEELMAAIKDKLLIYSSGITAPILSALVGASVDRVRRLLRDGVAKGVYVTTTVEGKALYFLAGWETFAGKRAPHRTVNLLEGTYDGAELKPLPGINRERFEAYTLPSIRGAWRVWPDGTKERI